MRRSTIMGLLLLLPAGCAAPAVPASQRAVTAIELEYVSRFLTPVMAYSLLPLCPQPGNAACRDPATASALNDRQKRLHDTIVALRNFSDASPAADATTLIAKARRELNAAEALVPAQTLAPR